MRLLLDTSALIWFLANDRLLSQQVRSLIDSAAATAVVSAVSAYEIDLKRTLGRRMPALPSDLNEALERAGFELLPIGVAHASAAGRLDMRHKDPWDRLLIAQAQIEGLPIASSDPAFSAYGCRVIW